MLPFPIATLPFPPFSQVPADPVPTSVVKGPDGAFYVSQLTGFPFTPGVANIWRLVPGQTPTVYASGLTNMTDLAFGPDGSLYAGRDRKQRAAERPDRRVEEDHAGRQHASDGARRPLRAIRPRVPRQRRLPVHRRGPRRGRTGHQVPARVGKASAWTRRRRHGRCRVRSGPSGDFRPARRRMTTEDIPRERIVAGPLLERSACS